MHDSKNFSRMCWCDVCYHTMHEGESYYQCPRKHNHHWARTRSPYGVTWHVKGSEGAVSIELCAPCSARPSIDREREYSLVSSYRKYAW